jgi:hypothetical protein
MRNIYRGTWKSLKYIDPHEEYIHKHLPSVRWGCTNIYSFFSIWFVGLAYLFIDGRSYTTSVRDSCILFVHIFNFFFHLGDNLRKKNDCLHLFKNFVPEEARNIAQGIGCTSSSNTFTCHWISLRKKMIVYTFSRTLFQR